MPTTCASQPIPVASQFGVPSSVQCGGIFRLSPRTRLAELRPTPCVTLIPPACLHKHKYQIL